MTASSFEGNRTPSFPDADLLARLERGDGRIDEARTYLQILDDYLKTAWLKDQGTSRYNTAVEHYYAVEAIVERMEPRRSVEFDPAAAFQPQASASSLEQRLQHKEKTLGQLESEIIAAATSTNPRLALTQVAALNGFPAELVEHMANSLLREQGMAAQYDIDKTEYSQMVEKVREIELKLDDPGEKEFKLLRLAKHYRLSLDQMQQVYYKSLIAQNVSDPIDDQQLEQMYPGNQEWVMRGWIPREALILYHGQGGAGKTLFVQHLIKHVITGCSWEEYKVSGPGGVLYVQTDTGPRQLKEWLKQADIFGKGLPIRYHIDWQIEWMAQLYSWIKQQRPALVVIDSLTSVYRYSTVNENDVLYAKPILQMRDIAQEFGSAFLLIHHSNTAGQARGTKALRNAVDAVWNLAAVDPKDPSNTERLLTMEKFRARGLSQYKLKFDDDDFSWQLLEPETEDGQPVQNSSARWLIVNHLHKYPGTRFSSQDLAEAINIVSEGAIRRELSGLFREGLINRELNPAFQGGHSKGAPKHLYLIAAA